MHASRRLDRRGVTDIALARHMPRLPIMSRLAARRYFYFGFYGFWFIQGAGARV